MNHFWLHLGFVPLICPKIGFVLNLAGQNLKWIQLWASQGNQTSHKSFLISPTVHRLKAWHRLRKIFIFHDLHGNYLFAMVPWRNGEDAGLVIQGSAVRAPPQEIFHSNSGLLSFKKPETVLWTIAKYYHLLLLRG